MNENGRRVILSSLEVRTDVFRTVRQTVGAAWTAALFRDGVRHYLNGSMIDAGGGVAFRTSSLLGPYGTQVTA